jgi:DNA polymerase I
MDKKDLLSLLDNLSEEREETTLNRNSRVLLIDGLNLFFRNFAMLNIVNSEGIHVGGLGGFLRSLGTLINQIQPTSIYVVFDGEGSTTNRKNLLPEYKSGRHLHRITNWDTFEDLEEEHDAKVDQIVRLVQYLKCIPVKTVALDKVEADDIIAYLSKHITSLNPENKAFIVSSDKDFIQLTDEQITVYRPIEKDFYTKEVVMKKFGVLAENFIVYKTLMGDASDKIPGIKGLGAKKLAKLFPELGERPITLEEIIELSIDKHKEHVIYSRVVFDADILRRTYKIMDLHNPMMDDLEKEYLEELEASDLPVLNSEVFLRLYAEDGLRHLIKNVDYWIQNTFKDLISYNK